jgi:hypothetical protein
MALPLVGFFPWLLGLFTTALGSLLTWLMSYFAYRKAFELTVISGFLVVAGAMTVGIAVTIKALVIGLRMTLPDILSASTYFLPNNINQFLAAVITLRVSVFLYRWTLQTLNYYLPKSGYGSLV